LVEEGESEAVIIILLGVVGAQVLEFGEEFDQSAVQCLAGEALAGLEQSWGFALLKT
jgi:hypothetical protein